ncbi:MAG: hypothetical protein CMJ52_09105 [Planctomycetaceae bacterium]|nr:hypothetical protein [Planctomycetaceae bacterium]
MVPDHDPLILFFALTVFPPNVNRVVGDALVAIETGAPLLETMPAPAAPAAANAAVPPVVIA